MRCRNGSGMNGAGVGGLSLRAILLFNKGCNSPRLALPSLSSPSPLNLLLLSPFLLSLSLPRFPLPPLFRSSPSLSSLTRFPLSSLLSSQACSLCSLPYPAPLSFSRLSLCLLHLLSTCPSSPGPGPLPPSLFSLHPLLISSVSPPPLPPSPPLAALSLVANSWHAIYPTSWRVSFQRVCNPGEERGCGPQKACNDLFI